MQRIYLSNHEKILHDRHTDLEISNRSLIKKCLETISIVDGQKHRDQVFTTDYIFFPKRLDVSLMQAIHTHTHTEGGRQTHTHTFSHRHTDTHTSLGAWMFYRHKSKTAGRRGQRRKREKKREIG